MHVHPSLVLVFAHTAVAASITWLNISRSETFIASRSGQHSSGNVNATNTGCCGEDCYINCDAQSEKCKGSIPPSLFDTFWCADDGLMHSSNASSNNPLAAQFLRGADASIVRFCYSRFSADFSRYSATVTVLDQLPLWRPKYYPPCCDPKVCHLHIDEAELLYWPTLGLTSGATTVIGENDFTFVSPTIYGIYTHVSAINGCGQLTKSYPSVTLSFRAEDSQFYDVHVRHNFDAVRSNCSALEALRDTPTESLCARRNGIKQMEAACREWNDLSLYCNPFLKYPKSQLVAMEPGWKSCDIRRPEVWIYDPPRPLMPADALAPEPSPEVIPVVVAKPADKVSHELAPETNFPVVSDPGSSSKDTHEALGSMDSATNDPKSSDLDPQGNVVPPLADVHVTDGSGHGQSPEVVEAEQESGESASGASFFKAPKVPTKESEDPQDLIPSDQGPSAIDNPNADDNTPSPLHLAFAPTPVLIHAGTTITPDASSNYPIPGIGILSPGGSPLTINDAVYFLAVSASALYKNGKIVPTLPTTGTPLTLSATLIPPTNPATHPATATPTPQTRHDLTFKGHTFMYIGGGRYVVDGSNVGKGDIVMVEGTAVSVDVSGSGVAVVNGTETGTRIGMGTIGGNEARATASGAAIYEGAAWRCSDVRYEWVGCLMAALVIALI